MCRLCRPVTTNGRGALDSVEKMFVLPVVQELFAVREALALDAREC